MAGRLERVGAIGHDGAAAVGLHRADRAGHAGLALEHAELGVVVAGRREQQLQVGAGEALAAERQKTCAVVTPKVSAPLPVAAKRSDLAGQPQAAGELVGR